jgi:hypothetical protein
MIFKNVMHGGKFKYFFKKLPKNLFKNSFACKNYFCEKGLAILFQNNPLGLLITSFDPIFTWIILFIVFSF